MAVRTERSEVRTKTTEGQYSPVRLEQARLVSSLLYGTRVMLVSKLPAFENKKYTSYDHFHGNGPYGKIPTKKEPIRTPGFTPRLPCHIIIIYIFGRVLIVNSRLYGRCYVKKLLPLCIFLQFYTHLEENSPRSLQNVFDKFSWVLNLVFPRK